MIITYFFCDFEFNVEIGSFYRQDIYDGFRRNNGRTSDCLIKSIVVPKLVLPEKKPVFQNIQGLRVVLDGSSEYRYYSDFFSGKICQLLIDDGKQKVLQILENTNKSLFSELDLLNLLGLEKTLSEHGRFVLHSSFIETKQGAILFTAPSGTGKSTQADLWKRYRNAEIINGDRSGVWKSGNNWMAGGVPWCGTSGIMINKTMPLCAIVILKQGSENKIQELRLPVKIRRLLEQTTINPWNREMLVRAQMFWVELCKEIPVFQLSCRPDQDAVELLERKLEKRYE